MLNRVKKIIKKNKLLDDIIYLVYKSIEEKKIDKAKKNEIANSVKVPICTLEECAKELLVLNESKEESLPIVEVHDLIVGGDCKLKIPRQSVWEIKNATVYNNSEVILTDKGAIWPKYQDKQRFDMTIYGDENVAKVEDGYLFLRNSKIIQKVKNGYSLCGVFGSVWAHFLLLQLPKLYAYDELSEDNEEITIIMSKTEDKHINGLVQNYVNRHTNISILCLERGQGVECENLYYVDNLNYIIEHSDLISMAVGYFPKYTANLYKHNFEIEINNIKSEKEMPRKIFLERHTAWGSMKNQDEVKKYFLQEGFVAIEPHKWSLEEKLQLFNNAEIIVGPTGSAFSNLLFCKENTLALVFAPYANIQQNPYVLSYYEKYWNLKIMFVCGKGDNDGIHADYIVPLERIKEAYKVIMKGKEKSYS